MNPQKTQAVYATPWQLVHTHKAEIHVACDRTKPTRHVTVLLSSLNTCIYTPQYRPRWLGRWSASLYQDQLRRFMSHRVHARRGFFLPKQILISGKRESVSQLQSMKTDEQWECWTLCAIKDKGTHRGGGRVGTCDHGWSRSSLRVNPPTS